VCDKDARLSSLNYKRVAAGNIDKAANQVYFHIQSNYVIKTQRRKSENNKLDERKTTKKSVC